MKRTVLAFMAASFIIFAGQTAKAQTTLELPRQAALVKASQEAKLMPKLAKPVLIEPALPKLSKKAAKSSKKDKTAVPVIVPVYEDEPIVIQIGKNIYPMPTKAPENVRQKNWDKFLRHIRSGGIWSLDLIDHSSVRMQTARTFRGTKLAHSNPISAAVPVDGKELDITIENMYHPKDPHNHPGVWWTLTGKLDDGRPARDLDHVSKQFKDFHMLYSLFWLNGHAQHWGGYNCRYGWPASHGGCPRWPLKDIKWLFKTVGQDEPYPIWFTRDRELSKMFALRASGSKKVHKAHKAKKANTSDVKKAKRSGNTPDLLFIPKPRMKQHHAVESISQW